MADASALTLTAGDRVVYPNQGVCRVTGIEEKEVAGQKLVFVSMQREEDGARLYVPKPKLLSIGIRKVSTDDDVTKMFAFLKADTERADLDWKQRARTNVERMTTGGLMGLAEVVKGLQILSELRPLPTKERELYDNARHLLVEEIAASLGIEEKSAEDAVDVALFPPGKDRPKRTADEFKRRGAGEDDLEIGDDLLGIGDDLDLPSEEEPEEGEEEAAEGEGEEEAEEKPAAAKRGRPKMAALSDDEVTQPMGAALVPDDALPPKRKRGRPPKAKTAEAAGAAKAADAEAAAPAAPKKRGRPPKAKPAATEGEAPTAPKKRGRPPKKKDEEPTG